MSPNKRKIFASDTSDENDSFKHRRSSLRVNLSYCESLSDSGNGSLWRTEIGNDERQTNDARTVRRLSRNKSTYKENLQSDSDKEMQVKSDTKKSINKDSEMSVRTKDGIQLKRLTVNLEDISIKERCLETSCKRLKDAILCKTKQIFDRENELSVKTAMVLGNRVNHFASTHNSNIENKTVMPDITDHLKVKAAEEHEQYTDTSSDRQKEDQYSNIIATPTKSDERRSLEKTVDKSRLTQRRLFVEKDKQVEEKLKCRIIEDIVLKKNLPLFSLRQANQSGSPILSGSNRRLSLFRARSKLYSQNSFENLNNTSTVHSIQSMDIGMPVGCSTFIENNAMVDKEIDYDVDTSRVTYTTNKVISMEMTEVYGGIRMSKEPLQNRKLDVNNCSKNNKKEKFKEDSKKIVMKQNKDASSLQNIEHPINKITVQNDIAHFNLSRANDVNDQDIASVHIDTVVPMQVSIEDRAAVTKTRKILKAYECNSKTEYQNEKHCTISSSDSNDTIRSSLNVNTSLDAITEAGKARNIWESNIRHRINDVNQDLEAIINNKKSIVLNDQHESANTIRTSLQMNTSKDSMCKTWRKRNDKDNETRNNSDTNMEYSSTTENKKSNDIDSLENISLIERLRNITMRKQVFRSNKSRVSKIIDEDKRRSSNSGDSYVEATPYPISRSVLFRSQLKYKTHLNYEATCSSNLNSMDNEEKNEKAKSVASNSKVSNEMHRLSGTQKTMETNTITLEDTSSCNPFITQNQLTVIEDMPNGTESEAAEKNRTVQKAEYVPVGKGRRRLLPINENSQLCSISPIEKKKCTPEESTSAKRNKRKLKRKLPKRRSMRSKNNISNSKQDVVSNQMWSDSDCDISENKKKEKKKPRKPKKIISKKIFIKKFADENVLNILARDRQKEDQLIENGDSLDDFVKCRTISSQWNKYKSQKIVIVTTGLSKGDKSLVKSIVKSLGAAEMELNVSRRTTHVVSTGVRTVNLLRGIIRGCWLVTLEWVLKSLENNAWLDPERFEMKHFSKAVQENRKDRQLFGLSYIPELFAACGLMYIERKTTVPYDTLKELIKTAGGYITENIKLAKIIIGTNGLKETWIIDSITTGELQLTKLYQWK